MSDDRYFSVLMEIKGCTSETATMVRGLAERQAEDRKEIASLKDFQAKHKAQHAYITGGAVALSTAIGYFLKYLPGLLHS